MRIGFAQMTWERDIPGTIECIKRIGEYVDKVIIITDQTVSNQQVIAIQAAGGSVYYHQFDDDMPAQRSVYLDIARQHNIDWICVSDADEFYSPELCRDLRQLIEKAESKGKNLLGLRCDEQFESREWVDDLDMLKEYPAGYRKSDYYKNLIFKMLPGLRYTGVGNVGKTHETWSADIPWIPARLPAKYSYLHKKTALDIWRNAVRNVWQSGGGDNVGEVNPMWKPLREIGANHGIMDWKSLEKVLRGQVSAELYKWLYDALQVPPTNYGVETREVAKYYFAHHPDKIMPLVRERLEHPPVMPPDEEVRNFVRQQYFMALGRHPDGAGLEHYTNAIISGQLKREGLAQILHNSEEYREKVEANMPATEKIKLDIPVDVNIHLDESIYITAMQRSALWDKVIKPRLDLGKFILDNVGDPEAFIQAFYDARNMGGFDINQLSKLLLL
jgi:Domain of unknown function (DUF4214)